MRMLLVLIILLSLNVNVLAQEEVKSTQGIEIDASIAKTIKQQTKGEKQQFKKENKAKNKYLQNVSIIKKSNSKKQLKERDLEFLNKRLRIEQKRLQEIEQRNKKGEE